MKTLKLSVLSIALLLIPMLASAQQNNLTQTTLSSALTSSGNTVVLASGTGVTVGANSYTTALYIDREYLVVTANPGGVSGTYTVLRGQSGTGASAHASGTMVLLGRPSWFSASDPQGSCVLANVIATPIVNYKNGNQSLCSSVTLTFGPGFANSIPEAAIVTTAVASAAGAVTPSGPLFHVTGTAAITGFNIPVGCNGTAVGGCSFTIIPDGVFTWTTAGNIALAGTAVVNKALVFVWDAKNSKWIPSYIA
jgi:hypothetical protein